VKFIAPARMAMVAVVGAVALAGCSFVNPIITQKHYAPADGLQVQIGDVRASNLVIVTTAVDEPASLTGSLYNAGRDDTDIIIALDATSAMTVTIPAESQVSLGVDGDFPILANASVAPGLIAKIAIQSDATGVITTPVPVVDGSQPYYLPEVDALALVEIPAIDS